MWTVEIEYGLVDWEDSFLEAAPFGRQFRGNDSREMDPTAGARRRCQGLPHGGGRWWSGCEMGGAQVAFTIKVGFVFG